MEIHYIDVTSLTKEEFLSWLQNNGVVLRSALAEALYTLVQQNTFSGTVQSLANTLGITKRHAMRLVHKLRTLGISIDTKHGKYGGLHIDFSVPVKTMLTENELSEIFHGSTNNNTLKFSYIPNRYISTHTLLFNIRELYEVQNDIVFIKDDVTIKSLLAVLLYKNKSIDVETEQTMNVIYEYAIRYQLLDAVAFILNTPHDVRNPLGLLTSCLKNGTLLYVDKRAKEQTALSASKVTVLFDKSNYNAPLKQVVAEIVSALKSLDIQVLPFQSEYICNELVEILKQASNVINKVDAYYNKLFESKLVKHQLDEILRRNKDKGV